MNVDIKITVEGGPSKVWSLLRRKSERGATYPIRWIFKEPVTSVQIGAMILRDAMRRDENLRGFRFVDAHPPLEPK